MKKLFTIFFCLLAVMASAEVKMALLQPRVAEGSDACLPIELNMVRGELRKAFGWQSDFQVLTRTDVDQMLKELGFQKSGMVNDTQRKKVGEMTGAQYICVSTITKYKTQLYIESYLVDVETGQMTNPATQFASVQNYDYSTLQEPCNKLAKEMLGELGGTPKRSARVSTSRPGNNQNFTEDAWGINMKMIWVEGGEFMMGCTSEQSDCDDDENVHRVIVDGFYIGMLEVTQSQWEKVVGTSVYQQRDKANTSWPMRGTGADYPMYYVSWDEAVEFCRILSNKTGKTYTLPTEAQWEYAARGGKKADGTKYAGSNMIDAIAWYTNNSSSSTHPCNTKRANALGIYDMSGNVWEWCTDWYSDSYDSYDTNNPVGPSSGSDRVDRGGSWGSGAGNCRVAYRDNNPPSSRRPYLGFRVVLLP